MRYARPANYRRYALAAARSGTSRGARRSCSTCCLPTSSLAKCSARGPHFASLFLNAGATSSITTCSAPQCYDGPHRNPDWYVPRGVDPVLEVYALYDHIFGERAPRVPGERAIMSRPGCTRSARSSDVLLAIEASRGVPARIGVDFVRVEPRMSRDFLVSCRDEEQAAAQRASAAARSRATTARRCSRSTIAARTFSRCSSTPATDRARLTFSVGVDAVPRPARRRRVRRPEERRAQRHGLLPRYRRGEGQRTRRVSPGRDAAPNHASARRRRLRETSGLDTSGRAAHGPHDAAHAFEVAHVPFAFSWRSSL